MKWVALVWPNTIGDTPWLTCPTRQNTVFIQHGQCSKFFLVDGQVPPGDEVWFFVFVVLETNSGFMVGVNVAQTSDVSILFNEPEARYERTTAHLNKGHPEVLNDEFFWETDCSNAKRPRTIMKETLRSHQAPTRSVPFECVHFSGFVVPRPKRMPDARCIGHLCQ